MPFTRPTLQELIDRAIAEIETRLPGVDARLLRNNLNVLAKVDAAVAHGLYGYLDWISKQIFPDTSEAEILERQANIWGVTRKAATKAKGNITFTGTNGTAVPIDTVLQRSDGVEFVTDAEVTIVAGSAIAAITASVGGVDGNTAAASSLSLVTPIANIDSAAIVDGTGIVNGVDTETDDSLRDRLLDRIQEPPHGGADFDYIKWALEVAGVTRAWVFPMELGIGTVSVRFVVDDLVPIIPDAAKVTEVQDYIEVLKPVTAEVTVVAPVSVVMNFTINGLLPSTQAVKDAIEAELEDLLRREAEPSGTILISHIREAISIAAGETDHVLTVPAADVTHNVGEIATMGVITWT